MKSNNHFFHEIHNAHQYVFIVYKLFQCRHYEEQTGKRNFHTTEMKIIPRFCKKQNRGTIDLYIQLYYGFFCHTNPSKKNNA